MAIRGRKPKPEGEKVTRHQLSQGWIDVPDVPFGVDDATGLVTVELGKHPEGRRKWSQATRDWWEDIASMPHCVLWGPAEWRYARTTALIYDRFVKGDRARGGELRQREKILGTTLEARRDLRIRYVNPRAFAQLPDNGDEDAGQDSDERVDPMRDFEAERRRRLLNAT